MIKRQFHLDISPVDGRVIRVPSVNSGKARRALREFSPQVVVVNGTRIICNETLCAVDAPFINTHAGITPLYRGVHGGYWALREGRPDLVGTTFTDYWVYVVGPLMGVAIAVGCAWILRGAGGSPISRAAGSGVLTPGRREASVKLAQEIDAAQDE